MKYPFATGMALRRAYNRAARAISDGSLLGTQQSAGFLMPEGFPKGEGYQVFVQIVRFSEKQLKKDPLGGGLLR